MSLLATQLGGRLVDRFGSFRVGTVGTALVVSTVFVHVGYIDIIPLHGRIPLAPLYVLESQAVGATNPPFTHFGSTDNVLGAIAIDVCQHHIIPFDFR